MAPGIGCGGTVVAPVTDVEPKLKVDGTLWYDGVQLTRT